MNQVNDFVISVATVNGSGSQSSNNVLARTIFRMGLPVGAKNLFPSNIAGLPTWFSIRVSEAGFTGRRAPNEIVMAMNAATIVDDIKGVRPGGVFFYNSDLRFDPILLRDDVTNIGIPFREIVNGVTDSVKLKKLLTNMTYVGVLAECLNVDMPLLHEVIGDFFASKPAVVAVNIKAIEAGREFAREQKLAQKVPYKLKGTAGKNDGKVFIDGNTAGALGAIWGGCSFLAWYPITPSSSLAENFIGYSQKYRKDSAGRNNFCVVQAEDELGAISMVLGASWAGARAMTTTSGPGISLMSEAAGLSYFAEIPAVIWDVQRVGPSTGLPTRTMQGDILSAATLSHGDTQHVCLYPANPEECFTMGPLAFDLAEELQTLVLVLTDLDLGMNLWVANEFEEPSDPLRRGKVLDAQALENIPEFKRYQDIDGDGVAFRTLPGTAHPQAAYFTRGTGHDESSGYSEDNHNYRRLLTRLQKKTATAKKMIPTPALDNCEDAKVGIIAYGSTDTVISEARSLLVEAGVPTSYLRIKGFPLVDSIKTFIDENERIYVVEQNRDGQMMTLIKNQWAESWQKLHSILQFDGLPLEAAFVSSELSQHEQQFHSGGPT